MNKGKKYAQNGALIFGLGNVGIPEQTEQFIPE
jgi:hypothetical protein